MNDEIIIYFDLKFGTVKVTCNIGLDKAMKWIGLIC